MIKKIHHRDTVTQSSEQRLSISSLCLCVSVVGLLALPGCSALLPPRQEVIEKRQEPVSQIAADPALFTQADQAGGADYQVQRGDTLYSLARRHNTTPAKLAGMNNLPPGAGLKLGQRLRVPGDGAAAPVQFASAGEAPVPQAAPRIAVAQAELAPPAPKPVVQTVALTDAQPYTPPQSGRLIPAPRRAQLEPSLDQASVPAVDESVELSAGPALEEEAPAIAEPVTAKPQAPKAVAPKTEAPQQTAEAKPAERVPDPPARAGSGFIRPVEGRTLVGYGKQPGGLNNDGINVAAARGTTVKAADNGVVVYAGNELRGYGNMLLISHAGGWMTAYAHLDSMNVVRGDKVRRGQRIGAVGSTGNVTSPQLHFEIRRGKQPVDPEEQLAASAPQAAVRPPPVGAAR